MEWTPAIRRAMRRHVARALERLDPARFRQEPAFVAALLARLDGVVYSGNAGRIEIQGTVVADRGRNSAESIWGADFAIVGILDGPSGHVEKGVLGQAKRNSLGVLSPGQESDFLGQCAQMAKATTAALGLEVPNQAGAPVLVREIDLTVLREADLPRAAPPHSRSRAIGIVRDLGNYLADRFLPCDHGDARPGMVAAIGESNLSRLTIIGESAV